MDEQEKLTKDNLMQLENMFPTGQILLLLMSQYGQLELVKQQHLKWHKRHMLKLENGLEKVFQLKLNNQLESCMVDQLMQRTLQI